MKRLISAQIFAFVALFCLVSSVQAYKFAEGTNTRMVEIEKGDTLWGIGSSLFKAGMLPKWDLPHDAAVAKFIYSLRSFDRSLWEMTPLEFSSFARNLQPGMKFFIPAKKEGQIETKFAELEGNLALTKKMVGDLQAEAATLLETNKSLAVALQAETEKNAALRAELDMITAQSAEPDPRNPWKYIAATAVMALFFYVMAFFFYISAPLGRGPVGKSRASASKKEDAELQRLRTRRDELESQGELLADVAKNIEEDPKIVKSQTQLPYPGTQFRVCPSEKQPPKGLLFKDGGVTLDVLSVERGTNDSNGNLIKVTVVLPSSKLRPYFYMERDSRKVTDSRNLWSTLRTTPNEEDLTQLGVSLTGGIPAERRFADKIAQS